LFITDNITTITSAVDMITALSIFGGRVEFAKQRVNEEIQFYRVSRFLFSAARRDSICFQVSMHTVCRYKK